MKIKLVTLMISYSTAALLTASASAMDGVFDRSAEIDKYIEVLQSGTQMAVTAAANQIYWSGISDKRLGDALNARLQQDFEEISNPKRPPAGRPRFTWTVDEKYGVGLIEALASLGMPDYSATFEKIGRSAKEGGAVNKRLRNEAAAASKLVAFRSGLNPVMATRENHVEGGDPTSSMLINLLKSDNRLYRDFALDRIEREKLRDARLLEFFESQIVDYVNRSPVAKLDWRDSYMRRNIRVLGLTGDAKYRRTIELVLASNVDEGAKKHAQVAADLLSTPAEKDDALE